MCACGSGTVPKEESVVRIRNPNLGLRVTLQRVLLVGLAWLSQRKLDPVANRSQGLCLKHANGFSLELE